MIGRFIEIFSKFERFFSKLFGKRKECIIEESSEINKEEYKFMAQNHKEKNGKNDNT